MPHTILICPFSHTGNRVKGYCPTCKGIGLNITPKGMVGIPQDTIINYCAGTAYHNPKM